MSWTSMWALAATERCSRRRKHREWSSFVAHLAEQPTTALPDGRVAALRRLSSLLLQIQKVNAFYCDKAAELGDRLGLLRVAAREVRDAVAAQAQDIVDALEMVTPIDRGLLITQWGFTVFPDEVLIYNFTRYAGFGDGTGCDMAAPGRGNPAKYYV